MEYLVSLQPPQLCRRNTASSNCSLWFDISVPCPAAPADNKNLSYKKHCCESHTLWTFEAYAWLACNPKRPIGILGRPGVLGHLFWLQETESLQLSLIMGCFMGYTKPKGQQESGSDPAIPVQWGSQKELISSPFGSLISHPFTLVLGHEHTLASLQVSASLYVLSCISLHPAPQTT